MITNLLAGLLGCPLGHTVSPALHKAAAAQFSMDLNYFPFEVEKHNLKDALKGMQVLGFSGCNVTIPYKEHILDFVTEQSDVVRFLGAANTLTFRGNMVFADNTDWEGFLRSWDESNLGSIEGKSAVIIGAGGAADAVFYALAERGIRETIIFNRDKERGEKLAEKFIEKYPHLECKAYALSHKSGISTALKTADILINTTPSGMHPAPDNMPISIPSTINQSLVYYDLIYNPVKTKLAIELEKRGIKTACGLGMLVHQAALAFKRWFGMEPKPEPMFNKAMEILNKP